MPRMVDALREIEETGLRGEPDAALSRLAGLQTGMTDAGAAERVTVAEQAMNLRRLGGTPALALDICDRALDGLDEAGARGRVLLCRGRVSDGTERRRAFTTALTEFTTAGDKRGRALALGELAFPYEDDDQISHDYRARLGAEGLSIAAQTSDPYAVAVCAGNLAACETFLGRASALDRWRQAVDFMPGEIDDARTANVVALNGVNWALAAAGFGDYDLAAQVVGERAWLARGRRWERTFAAIEALIAWRRGQLGAAYEAAERAIDGSGDLNSAMGTIVEAACAFEREARPGTVELESAVDEVLPSSEQVGAIALAIRARVRAARREPDPARGLVVMLARANRRGRRFGWEDLVMALSEIRPAAARRELKELGDLWPAGARAEAAHRYVEGLLDGSCDALVAAGDRFLALPEPVTAGHAFHAAARLATDAARANRLRMRAMEAFQACGAERSLAGVLRDGQLRRSPGVPRIPASQRNAVHAGLTPREHEVALLARRGLTGGEIAERLSITEGTVRNHLLRIREKLGGVPKRKLSDLFVPDEY